MTTIITRWMSLLFLMSSPVAAHGAVFEIPSGDVTVFIAAINTANANGEENTINLEPGRYTLTSLNNSGFFPANGLPVINSTLTITGTNEAESTVIEREPAASRFRIFEITNGGNLTIRGLTVKGGAAISGGAIINSGRLTIDRSIISDSVAQQGGGIANFGHLTVTDSFVMRNVAELAAGGGITNHDTAIVIRNTIIDNDADLGGGFSNWATATIQDTTIADNIGFSAGGVWNAGMLIITSSTVANNQGLVLRGGGIRNNGTLTLTNSTIAGNRASSSGGSDSGGILNSGLIELQNSIVALNTAVLGGPDCFGNITSRGNNVFGDLTACDISFSSGDLVGDPGLGAFKDNETPGGGYFSLVSGSQAIDAGNNNVCPSTDQLGQPRTGNCDIGAIEFQPNQPPLLVSIDFRPNSSANKINLKKGDVVNVAVFSDDGFDSTVIDAASVRFGPSGTEASPVHVRRRDVNGDGRRDMVVRFEIDDTAIQCGDTSATLTGQVPGAGSFSGSSSITTTGCRQ